MFASRSALKSLGVVGMNDRNINLIARQNPRRLFPLVDNKLKTKLLAKEHGLPTPGLIGSLSLQHEVREIESIIHEQPGFAIKPASGSGGKGILVIVDRQEDDFVKGSGQLVDMLHLKRHASNILSGLFSLGGSPDVAIVEELIRPDPLYENLSVEGVPDLRVIVYRGFPIMAMLRLSTRVSDGKANLHQGAVGVGVSILSGQSMNAVQFDKQVLIHPDTGADLHQIRIPGWDNLLTLAARCAEASGLGFLGVDLVLDVNKGPMLLELNARPGLAIQIANGKGLMPCIEAIDGLPPQDFRKTAADRVAIAKDALSFGATS